MQKDSATAPDARIVTYLPDPQGVSLFTGSPDVHAKWGDATVTLDGKEHIHNPQPNEPEVIDPASLVKSNKVNKVSGPDGLDYLNPSS